MPSRPPRPNTTGLAGGPPGRLCADLSILALAFAAGVGSFYLLPEAPPPWVAGPTGLLVLALLWLGRRTLSQVGGAFLLGALWALLRSGPLLWAPFPEQLARAPLTIEGRIAAIPTDLGFARRFLFEVDRARRPGEAQDLPFRGLVRLSWYAGPRDLKAGERWRLPVRLKPRHGLANPGGFDYERWLFEQGIAATGHLRKGEAPERLDQGAGPYWLSRWRQGFNDHLALVLGDTHSLPLVQALVTGTQSGFDQADWEVMNRTGTSHLVAISGLNLGLVAALAFMAIRALWSRCATLTQALAAPRAAAVGAFLAAFAYAALAGFSVSTRRALIMSGVLFALLYWRRTPRHWNALILALGLVLLLDPASVLSYGFWLSFAAVAVLLFNLGQRLPRRDLWSRFGRAQWAVAVGLLPLLLLLFGRASLIAPAVNLVAEPLFTLVLFPLVLGASLLSLVPGLSLPLLLTGHLLDACLDLLSWVAAWPWAAASLPQGPFWVWPAAALGVVMVLSPRGVPGRWLGLPLLLPLALARLPGPGPGEVWFSLLDVGQGLAAVVRTQGGTLVFDTGPGFDSGFNTGTRVLVPFLQAQGLKRVDVLILSHADRDHIGGAAGLLERVSAGQVLSGEPQELDLPQAQACVAGQEWHWSGVRLQVLHPTEPGVLGNDASCVLRVQTGGRAILLTGDITARIESRLVARLGRDLLRSDVLVAAHHGSASSSSAAFLDAVDPELVLFACGYANHFGFPAEAVRRRVEERGMAALNTGLVGALDLRLGADGRLQGPWTWRDRSPRLWRHRPAP